MRDFDKHRKCKLCWQATSQCEIAELLPSFMLPKREREDEVGDEKSAKEMKPNKELTLEEQLRLYWRHQQEQQWQAQTKKRGAMMGRVVLCQYIKEN